MKNKLKLLLIIFLSLLFSLTIMSVIYIATYMDIQTNPTTLLHVITMTKDDKTTLLVALNVVFTIALSLYSFVNLYLSFYKGNSTNVQTKPKRLDVQ